MTSHPTRPHHHIDFQQHLDRPFKVKQTGGPNLESKFVLNLGLKIDFTRTTYSNIDLNTKKFRPKVRTRFDRVGAEPNTRLDYDPPANDLGGMVTMNKTLSRTKEFFPIVDPIIKKAGDKEMK